jgi:plastocyanin
MPLVSHEKEQLRMPFAWRVNIKKNPKKGGPAIFEFEETPQVNVGDLVFWSNDDTVAHFPGLAGNPTAFMSNQIAAGSSSPNFAPAKISTINYICSLHEGETGVINVVAPTLAPKPKP